MHFVTLNAHFWNRLIREEIILTEIFYMWHIRVNCTLTEIFYMWQLYYKGKLYGTYMDFKCKNQTWYLRFATWIWPHRIEASANQIAAFKIVRYNQESNGISTINKLARWRRPHFQPLVLNSRLKRYVLLLINVLFVDFCFGRFYLREDF